MIKCYSQRLVNPFRGILSVVATEDADAVSSDGVHWALYIQGESEEVRMNDGSLRDVVLPDTKFGDWTAKEGLKRSPVRNVADLDRIDVIGLHLLEAVKQAAGRLPFPLRDQDELWLLDAADRPLALLHVAVDEGERVTPRDLTWRPGEIAKHVFTSTHARIDSSEPCSAAQQVEDIVNRDNGTQTHAQWFWRSTDGTGVGQDGVNISSGLVGRTLAACEFPPLLLSTEWAVGNERALVQDFLDWQAPWLLQLQHLSHEQRSRLEQLAAQRADAVAKCFRLYPEVIDAERITAARVEAQLRGGSDTTANADDAAFAVDVTLIPYYRE
jgi:hypothetical protein